MLKTCEMPSRLSSSALCALHQLHDGVRQCVRAGLGAATAARSAETVGERRSRSSDARSRRHARMGRSFIAAPIRSPKPSIVAAAVLQCGRNIVQRDCDVLQRCCSVPTVRLRSRACRSRATAGPSTRRHACERAPVSTKEHGRVLQSTADTAEYCRVLQIPQSTAEYCRAPVSTEEHGRVLKSTADTAEYCRVLQSTAEYCRALQSTAEPCGRSERRIPRASVVPRGKARPRVASA